MGDCGCHTNVTTTEERKILWIALGLNATMFIVGLIAGLLAQSTGLLADSLDMLADASAYAIGLLAIGRSQHFKSMAAMLSGSLLLLLSVGVLMQVGWHTLVGSSPDSHIIILIAGLSLLVNTGVLRLLGRLRKGEAHLRAAWIFTRADVIVNCGVILSGILVAMTHSRYPDLMVGTLVGLYVLKEACHILSDARK